MSRKISSQPLINFDQFSLQIRLILNKFKITINTNIMNKISKGEEISGVIIKTRAAFTSEEEYWEYRWNMAGLF